MAAASSTLSSLSGTTGPVPPAPTRRAPELVGLSCSGATREARGGARCRVGTVITERVEVLVVGQRVVSFVPSRRCSQAAKVSSAFSPSSSSTVASGAVAGVHLWATGALLRVVTGRSASSSQEGVEGRPGPGRRGCRGPGHDRCQKSRQSRRRTAAQVCALSARRVNFLRTHSMTRESQAHVANPHGVETLASLAAWRPEVSRRSSPLPGSGFRSPRSPRSPTLLCSAVWRPESGPSSGSPSAPQSWPAG
jgi:hypothetical protein